MKKLDASLIVSIQKNERVGTGVAKERARLIHKVDAASGVPMGATELSKHLQAYGVEVKPERITQARKVLEVLKALDPEHLDPAPLRGVNDTDTLTLMHRVHKENKASYQDMLPLLEHADRKERLKKMLSGESQTTPPWRYPLQKVPSHVADAINKEFGAWCKETKMRPTQALEEFSGILQRVGAKGLRFLSDDRLQGAVQNVEAGLGVEREEAVNILLEVISALTSANWKSLHDSLTD